MFDNQRDMPDYQICRLLKAGQPGANDSQPGEEAYCGMLCTAGRLLTPDF
jgi:hypothetical protein